MITSNRPDQQEIRGSIALNLRIVFVTLLSIATISIDHNLDKSHSFRERMEWLVYPLQQVVEFPISLLDWVSEKTVSTRTLQEKNASLHKKNILLKQKLQQQAAIEYSNDHLRKLLKASYSYGDEKVVIAEIVSIDLDSFNQEIILNKGSDDQVYEGQLLIDGNGVMGQITRVSPKSSTALLISSPNQSIPVQNQRNGVRAIVSGTGNSNRLKLNFVANGSDITVGDQLLTSGLGDKFPFGYPVGTVNSIENSENEIFATVSVTPTADLASGRYLLLIWPIDK
ncbi:MAG: rod shape-determining protein MreC [Thiotrichales bacterium]|nr:rod shape-determining protein MreC [Thiotrichales bacterium]MBT3612791.1 rod shape-determining protein MreC [Thiotrichales bacterium]MBT3753305.1 rod shape-determining protein MreC [Thiotrichales bacterium]MBT3837288.1 rod shape-determining protein MreC [Thiotrichales bacterium]MBT4261435.1 rod shape-determining protein MreC [Thiotrichales bacterium]